MARQQLPNIGQNWTYQLSPTKAIDSFLSCSEELLTLEFITRRGSSHTAITINTGIEHISGNLEEVKAELTSSDKANAQSAALQIVEFVPNPQGSGQQPRQGAGVQQHQVVQLNLNSAAKQISINVNTIGSTTEKQKILEILRKHFREPTIPIVPTSGLREGVQIDNYRLVTKLGSGFSSDVWECEVVKQTPGVNLQMGDIVAMKQYKSAMNESYADSIRIQREFKVTSEVEHDSLVKVHDLMIAPIRPFSSFMIMERVQGSTLKEKIPNDGFDSETCIEIGKQLASALSALHSHGAVHRDVKPANIMMVSRNPINLKLLDLGIVTLVFESGLTENSIFLGSKHTASPEQLFGEDVDRRADVYALGATLFHCYIGKPMYSESGPPTAIVKEIIVNPASCKLKDDADTKGNELIEFINKCICTDRSDRPSNAQECLKKLNEC